ncbi:MAG: DUF2865 domain-containing protein [Hyphomicrobiaceae bacterium]
MAQDWMRGSQSREQLPRIESEMRTFDRAYQQSQAQLDRADCYDYFFFSKTLRRTRRCLELSRRVEDARRRLAELEAQRQQILSAQNNRGRQDEIVRELARHGCGRQYQQEAAKRQPQNPFSFFWQDQDGAGPGYGPTGPTGPLPFATYRTLCVRTCDGYYFPVSFATLPNHFERDEQVCQSKCAAPTELYYYQNPGASVEQMMSYRSQELYTKLPAAFRYRKELVRGCSCKPAEYAGADGTPGSKPQKDAPPATTPPPPEKSDRLRRFGR